MIASTRPHRGVAQRALPAALALALGLSVVLAPPQAAGDDLQHPEVCSGPILSMMADGAVMAYLFSPRMCPFCPFDEMMATFMNQVLADPSLTADFLDCAAGNPELVGLMIEVAADKRSVLHGLADLVARDCRVAHKAIWLAVDDPRLGDFLLGSVDPYVLGALSYGILCEPPTVAEGMGLLMERHGDRHLGWCTPFVNVLMDLRSPDDDDDAMEMATERLLYGLVRDLSAGTHFLRALGRLPADTQAMLVDLLFLGQQRCCYAPDTDHPNQAYHNGYALIAALARSVAPHYQLDAPPDPGSAHPANALLGGFLPLLFTLDPEGMPSEPTPHGLAFLRALRAAAEVYCNPDALALLRFVARVFPPAMLQALPAADPEAPAPRDFHTGSGAPLGEACPAAPCSPFAPQRCNDERECAANAGRWCLDGCQVGPCAEPPPGQDPAADEPDLPGQDEEPGIDEDPGDPVGGDRDAEPGGDDDPDDEPGSEPQGAGDPHPGDGGLDSEGRPDPGPGQLAEAGTTEQVPVGCALGPAVPASELPRALLLVVGLVALRSPWRRRKRA